MSTRSIIAIPTDTDWKGRYVHWDGYPSNMGKELSAIIQRDGYENAIKILTQDHKSWSGINSDPLNLSDPQGHTLVPGYGVAHADIPADDDPWLLPGDEDWTEWVYLLLPFGIAVYERSNADAGDLFRGLYDWAEDHDWITIQETIYSNRQEA
jgi:hypothetical protein